MRDFPRKEKKALTTGGDGEIVGYSGKGGGGRP